ncbi:streptophobe family protein, partial [Actinomadura sp. WAC 06369]|uniref:streptophobe family protein n=1 Tax=Actinomadura sp. WAC 06369 TaxID=2203193 RepID=UPI00100093E3
MSARRPAPPPASGAPPARAPWRQAAEGAAAAAGGLGAMALTAAAALTAAGGAEVAPLTRLVPALVSMAVGGGVDLTGEVGGGAGGAAGGMLGGMSPGLTGRIGAVPLMLTFVGTVVMAVLFFRPLRRRARPTGRQFAARAAGTLTGCVVAVAVLASSARGTARLPGSLTERLGGGAGGGLAARFGGRGGGGALSEAAFRTDVVPAACLAAVWAAAVIAIGCLAARRTRLPRAIEESRVRLRWRPLLSASAGVLAVLCGLLLAAGLVAAGAAAAGREQAGGAAAGLLLAGANLLGVLLTTGAGEPWRAGVRREQG